MEKKLKYDEIVMELAEEEIEESFDLYFTELPEEGKEVIIEGVDEIPEGAVVVDEVVIDAIDEEYGGEDLEPTISE